MRLSTSERLALVAARWAVALDPEGKLDRELADALRAGLSGEDEEWARQRAIAAEREKAKA